MQYPRRPLRFDPAALPDDLLDFMFDLVEG
jgi:hypothetical protein